MEPLWVVAEAKEPVRAALWVDALRGEPVTVEDMIEDLKQVRVIYLGEYHTIPRHHALEKEMLDSLAHQGMRMVLAMEQFDFTAQPALDQFNARTIDLPRLIRETDLPRRWPGHTNYLALLEAAGKNGVPVLALNARAETIRAIARGGLAGLSPRQRGELPSLVQTDDPTYERLLNQSLSVHMAFDPNKLRPVFEAQVARDETMSARLAEFLNSPAGRDRVALVICGRGHCEFGLGTPERVERRMPKITQRILLFSESGDLQLTESERKQAREIEISHQFLRDIGRPAGDYFHIMDRSDGPLAVSAPE
jgi:uncharacterized iron-regulated protein